MVPQAAASRAEGGCPAFSSIAAASLAALFLGLPFFFLCGDFLCCDAHLRPLWPLIFAFQLAVKWHILYVISPEKSCSVSETFPIRCAIVPAPTRHVQSHASMPARAGQCICGRNRCAVRLLRGVVAVRMGGVLPVVMQNRVDHSTVWGWGITRLSCDTATPPAVHPDSALRLHPWTPATASDAA